MSKICVVGLGYIGLPTAAMLASCGHEVVGCDVNERSVTSINGGLAHFQEPDLQMLLTAAVQTGRLRAQTTPAEADYFILAVPTPVRRRQETGHVLRQRRHRCDRARCSSAATR